MSSISPNISSSASTATEQQEDHKADDSYNGTIEQINPSSKSSITPPPHNFNLWDNDSLSRSCNEKSSQSSWLLRLNPKYLVWRYFVKLFKAEQFLRRMYNTDDFGVIYNNVSRKYEQYKKNHQLPKESLFFTNIHK